MRLIKLSLILIFSVVITNGIWAQPESKVDYEDGLAEVNGTELYYKIIGEGEPIVILHGGPGMDHNHLFASVGKLSSDLQVIFYDQRGTGNSSGEIDSAKINTATFVEDLEAIRKVFDLGKMNLMGMSWGGMLAMQYAMAYPDRLNTLILGCTMGASSDFFKPFGEILQQRRTSEDSLAMAKIREIEGYKNYDREIRNKFSRLSFKTYFHPDKQHLAESIDFNNTPNTFKNGGTVRSLILQEYRDYDFHDDLQVVSAPTLILHGDADPILPKFVEQIHRSIPNSEFVLLEDTGHFIFVEAADEFLSRTIRFVEQHSQ